MPGYYKYIPMKKTKAGTPGFWSDKKRLEVAKAYVATGSWMITSNQTGVPYDTLMTWNRKDWWKNLIAEIRSSEAMETTAKFQKVLDKTLTVIDDRLENGDFEMDKITGKLKRIPVKMKDANRVMVDVLTKKNELIEKHEQPKEDAAEKVAVDILKELANKFTEFALKKEPKRDVVLDIEDANVIYDTKTGEHLAIYNEQSDLQEVRGIEQTVSEQVE